MKRDDLISTQKRMQSMLEGIGRELEATLNSAGPNQHPLIGGWMFSLSRDLESVMHRANDILMVLADRCDEAVEAAVDKALRDGKVVVVPEGKEKEGPALRVIEPEAPQAKHE